MAFGSASAVGIAYVKEVTWGVNPGSGFEYARFTSDTLKQDTTTEQSAEIRNDRNNVDLIRTDVTASGDVNYEFSVGTYDDWIEGAMCSTWQALQSLSSKSIDISAASGQTATLTDAGTSNAFANFSVGQWIKIDGFTAPADNGYCYITSKASSNSVGVSGLTFVNESGQTDITIVGSVIRVGIVKNSYTIERQWTDIANVYQLFLGMRVNQWSLTVAPGAIATGRFAWLGKSETPNATTQAGTPSAATTVSIVNAIDNVVQIREGSIASDSTDIFTEISFDLNNNLRAQTAIGVLGAADVALGTAVVTGTLNAYLQNKTLEEKYTAFSESLLSFRVTDPVGNTYIFTFPRIKYGGGDTQVRGQNTDGLVSLNWVNLVDSNGVAMQVDRFQ